MENNGAEKEICFREEGLRIRAVFSASEGKYALKKMKTVLRGEFRLKRKTEVLPMKRIMDHMICLKKKKVSLDYYI